MIAFSRICSISVLGLRLYLGFFPCFNHLTILECRPKTFVMKSIKMSFLLIFPGLIKAYDVLSSVFDWAFVHLLDCFDWESYYCAVHWWLLVLGRCAILRFKKNLRLYFVIAKSNTLELSKNKKNVVWFFICLFICENFIVVIAVTNERRTRFDPCSRNHKFIYFLKQSTLTDFKKNLFQVERNYCI